MLNYMCLSSDLVKQLHRQHRVRARQLQAHRRHRLRAHRQHRVRARQLQAHRPLQQQLQLRKRPLQQQRA